MRIVVGGAGVAVSVLILIPSAILTLGHLLGASRCVSASAAFLCSAPGRILTALTIIAVLAPLAIRWGRWLQGVISYKGP